MDDVVMPQTPEQKARRGLVAESLGNAINTVIEQLTMTDAELLDVLTGVAALVAVEHDAGPTARAAFLEYCGESWDRMRDVQARRS